MKKRGRQDKKAKEAASKTESDTAPASLPNGSQFEVAFLQHDGIEPFTKWFQELRDRTARQRIAARLKVVSSGSLGNTETVGDGVNELKIDYGPGYRVYYGREGRTIVVIISGGDKSTQTADIKRAQDLWKEHNATKNP